MLTQNRKKMPIRQFAKKMDNLKSFEGCMGEQLYAKDRLFQKKDINIDKKKISFFFLI